MGEVVQATNIIRLGKKLQETETEILRITIGDGNPTVDEVAGEILKGIEQIERGDYEIVDIDGEINKQTIEEFLT